MFLGSVMPKHKACLLKEEGDKEQTIRYVEITNKMKSHNWCSRWLKKLDEDNDLDDGDEDALNREVSNRHPT